jgi:hypothetical protein
MYLTLEGPENILHKGPNDVISTSPAWVIIILKTRFGTEFLADSESVFEI